MIIVVTGANGGIGSKIVSHLGQANKILALVRTKTAGNQIKNLENKNITPLVTNISSLRSVKKTFAHIKKIDVLINCAAILTPVGKFLDNDLDSWRQNITTNLLGTVYCCQYALPKLLKSRQGKIINFSGGGAANGRPYHSAYASAKAAVVRFSETVAMEYPQIDVNAIAPGPHKTKLWDKETFDTAPKQWGNIEKLLKFIDFLISKKSDGISGKFIHYLDNWPEFTPNRIKGNLYTLRRVEK